MWRIAILLLVGAESVAAQQNCDPALAALDTSCLEENPASTRSKAKTAKEALREFFSREFTSAAFKKRGANSATLELCRDQCDLYRAARVTRESELWDLAFLRHYYFAEEFDQGEFTQLYGDLSGPILKAHAGGCTATEEKELAKCVVNTLAKKLGAVYWFVRYDEGGVCETRHRLTERGTIGEPVCRELKKEERSPTLAAPVPAAPQQDQRPSQVTAALPPTPAPATYGQAQALERDGKGPDAVDSYVRAARSGSGEAALRLGQIYELGIPGVPRDYGEAFKWYNAARVLGQRVPLRDLRVDLSKGEPGFLGEAARMEAEGQGVAAVRVYIRAANVGSAKAAFRLALIYGQGIAGVEPNHVEAEKWASAARALGQLK